MARATTQTRKAKAAPALAVLFALALGTALLFLGQSTASGAGEADASTLGLGAQRQTLDAQSYSFDAAEKLGVEAAAARSLASPAQRTASQEDFGPVVELAAVDLGDPATIKAAAQIGVLNPPAGAKTRAIDTSGDEWQTGIASGYDVESSSTLTRSGRAFDDNCVTVAVPEGMEDLLGHPVVIVYSGMVVVATVTDTGGFAQYGRALDLGGGVFKAFGHDDIWDWGIREVKYKFL